jgi:phosphate/phosphite/phosphonate ABC transporter binding protein
VNIGLRQRLIILIFSGLVAAMAVIGTYRYFMEKRVIINTTRTEGERSCKLMAELAAPYVQTSDIHGLLSVAQKFMHAPDIQEVTVIDREGRRLIHTTKQDMPENRIAVGPVPILSDTTKLGEISMAVYPEGMGSRLKVYALSTLVENFFIFVVLAGILAFFITRSITKPVKEMGAAVKDLIDRRDFTRRVEARGRDEIGDLANGVNYLIERLEQFIVEMGDISARINEVSPTIASEAREVKKNAEGAAGSIASVSTSVAEMSASLQSFSENAESLSTSAEEASSAILEMNASNQEVATHTNELTSSVEDVTASVSEMIASIREVGGHVESLSSASEETSASAIQIEATVREVERAAKESAQLSQQVSREAQEIGVKSIQETVKAIDAIKGAVSRYSDLVTRLGQRSGEIGKILGVIVEVTEKTNLLALNASILAAQAGEHGKGFGVVAEEIKALADRTAGSAQDIAKLISSVQKETRDAVTALSDGLSAVEEGVRRSREAGAALDKILSSSTRSSEMASMIERAMTEQARGIKQVSEAFANVKQMSAQIMTATHAQTKGTEMILHAAEGMRDIARQVRNAMAEQARGGKQIGAAAENVTTRAGAIAAGTWEQRQTISKIQESMERIQDLPRQSVRRVESMAASVETLGEQAALLNQEIVTMTVRRGRRYIKGGTLRMSIIPLDTEAEMHRRFAPLAEYLSRTTGRRVEVSVAPDFAHLLRDLEDNNTDLLFLTPLTYIGARKKADVLPLVKALLNGVPFTHSTIVTRNDSGITRLEDVKGKRFAFGVKTATLTYLIPRAMLAEAGIQLSDLKEFTFLGHQDAVVKALLAGDYDAGGLPELTAKGFEGSGLKVLKTSIAVPEKNICASKHLDPQTSELIKNALVALDRKDRAHAEILGRVNPGYSGFEVAADEEYDGVRKLMVKVLGTDTAI